MKYEVGDKVRVRIDLVPYEMYGSLTFLDGNMSKCAGQICTIKEVPGDKKYYVSENPFAWSEEMLEPVDSKTLLMADGTIIGEFNTGGVLPTSELMKKEFNVTWIDKIALPTATETKEMVERVRREFFKLTNAFPKEDKKLKFTFYVTEGTRVDKSCNGTIPTMTTIVEANSYSRTAPVGIATCDKVDYDMRQGVLEALANMYCDGDFDKAFNKAVKRNELADKKKRTCTYCGKVFDTVEEREAEEAWHVERKKARRERYLLRKRAKEIAFEEAAQKLAKEIITEDNKK